MTQVRDWLGKSAATIVFVLGIIALIATVVSIRSCGTAQTSATEAKLATGQTEAAIETGADAVNTVGNAAANATEIHQTAKEGTDAIQAAPAGDSNDAADRAVCRMRIYRNSPKCVALLGPAA
jgi:hypothetical protein